ncbi:MAG: Holliday junction resolvase RuvX [bacterium]
MSKYLGIDYGLANLGLAIADGPLARPLFSLKVASDAETLTKLTTLIEKHDIETIIIGLPEGKLAPIIKKFAQNLARLTSLSVHLHPETLSTKEAILKLRSLNASKKKLRNDHVYAACLILEDYLETLSTP